jgi:hypothetical protein
MLIRMIKRMSFVRFLLAFLLLTARKGGGNQFHLTVATPPLDTNTAVVFARSGKRSSQFPFSDWLTIK